MSVEILEVNNGFYIPMDGPWQSDEDNKAFAAAERKFEELKQVNKYVALIQSHHEYTHGYWIEVSESQVEYPDHIIKLHTVNHE